jgi:serine/threonine protein kinase
MTAKRLLNERHIWTSISNNPSFISLFSTFQTNSHICFVMELAEQGDLFNFVLRRVKLSEQHAQFFMAQIVSGIAFLHENDVIYRDLKPEVNLTKNSIYFVLKKIHFRMF